MFYCSDCAKKNSWPETYGQSFGVCEVCTKTAICSDLPSSELPACLVQPIVNQADSAKK